MGFLSNLFSRSSSSDDAESDDETTMIVCEGCEEEVPEDEAWDGLCQACDEVSGGPSYCCGAIYEMGETTCMSCGEPL